MRTFYFIWLFFVANVILAQEYYEIDPVIIDDRYDHYMPVVYQDRIVFSSNNADEAVIKYTIKDGEKAPTGLYIATIVEGELQGTAEPFARNINTNLHEGPATFTADGKTLIYTRNLHADIWIGNDKKKKNKLRIFFSTKTGETWSDPQAFEFNNENYSVGHPTISSDGTRLYFASNKPGGFGGTDLYVSKLENGKWGEPENLGAAINSKENDMFPSLQNGEILYFSSDRTGGSGGLDILMTRLRKGKWIMPAFLPEPLNSIADEMGFAPLPDQRTGYLSSNRNGKDEIMFFKRTIPLFKDCSPQVENNYCYVFEEEGTLDSDTLPLAYQWDLGDGNTHNGQTVEHCYAGPGKYTIKLNIVDTVSESIFFNEASYELDIEDIEQPYVSVLGPMNSRILLSFSAEDSRLHRRKVAEYNWDLGDGTQLTGSKVSNRYKDAGEKVVKLDVIYEPDSSGKIDHQCVTRSIFLIEPKQLVELSEETVLVEYKGADGQLRQFMYQELPYDLFDMSVKNGEDVFFTVELLASKERVSTSDPYFDKARDKFKILEHYISDKEHFSYSVGKEDAIEGTFPLFRELKAMEYKMPIVKAVKLEKVKEIGNPEDMAALEQLNVEDLNNTVLRMSTVYFNTGDYSIDSASTDALDKLYTIISAFDRISLEISAYTDDIGPDAFNIILSEKRAESIVDYLSGKGLHRDRMKAIGYGEDHPIADNNTESGRQLNRRVEFKLVTNKLLTSDP